MERTRTRIERKYSKGSVAKYPWVRSLLLLFISLVVLVAISFKVWEVFTYIISVESVCGGCKSTILRLKDREELDSTLYIFEEGIENSKIIGGWLVVTNSNLSETLVLYMPPGVYVADPNELFSEYIQFADLSYAGDLINEKRSKEYSLWQTINMSGFNIENYVWITGEGLTRFNNLFGDVSVYSGTKYRDLYSNEGEFSDASLLINSFADRFNVTSVFLKPTLWGEYIEHIDTTFNSTDYIFQTISLKNRFAGKNLKMIDLSQDRFLNTAVDPSGREIRVINYSEFDRALESSFNILRSRDVEKEQAKVEVYNGSGISGLASRYARKVKNYGVKVVRFDNSPSEYDKTKVYIPHPDRFPNSYSSVKDLVCDGCDIVEGRPDFITTGDIIVILGKDKEKELRWR